MHLSGLYTHGRFFLPTETTFVFSFDFALLHYKSLLKGVPAESGYALTLQTV